MWAFNISTHTLTWSVTERRKNKMQKVRFQLTRSRGAWHIKCSNFKNDDYFNSHAHVERDLTLASSLIIQNIFQLTRSRGAWPLPIVNRFSLSVFQLTRSRGAWLISDRPEFASQSFQLTRSRGAWRYTVYSFAADNLISTHTLTWSVTNQPTIFVVIIVISTHTLTWSVTIPR